MNKTFYKSLVVSVSLIILGAGCSLPRIKDTQPLYYNTDVDISFESKDTHLLQGNALVYISNADNREVLFSDLRDEIQHVFPSWNKEEISVEFLAEPKDADKIFFGVRYLYSQKIWEMDKGTHKLRETDISWSGTIISPSGRFLARLETEYQIGVVDLATKKKTLFETLPKGFSYAQTYSALDGSAVESMSWSQMKSDVIIADVFLDTPGPLSNAFVERKPIAAVQYFVDSN